MENIPECSQLTKQKSPIRTAHDWTHYKQSVVYDDGTLTFFWRAHTLTVLALMTGILVYVAVFDHKTYDKDYNTKRGIVACASVFILLGVTLIPDGPFTRPHPVLWRFVLCVSILYELSLIFILFQNISDARQLLTHIDSNLGKPLPEKDYGGSCRIYEPGHPEGAFHNVIDKCDVFVPAHIFGWFLKTLILRDYWLCMVISIMFEFLEYTLEHQLPNFSECWWDHWIMDVIVCNGLGIYLGMKTLEYLRMKPYYWRGLFNIPTYSGKLKRIAQQFSPYSWVDYAWKPLETWGRWFSTIGVTFIFLLAELNTFYLKFVLWLPPAHGLNGLRLLLHVLAGAVGLRECFQFLDDPDCKKIGFQAWLILAFIITELLVVLKFGWDTVTLPIPPHILYCWILGFIGLVVWTFWHFFLHDYLFIVKEAVMNSDHKREAVNHSDDEAEQNGVAGSSLTHAQMERKKKSSRTLKHRTRSKSPLNCDRTCSR